MKNYTVIIHPEPIEFEVEAESKEQAERIARNSYNGEPYGSEKAEVLQHCEECGSECEELVPYKLDQDYMVCENCLDELMEE